MSEGSFLGARKPTLRARTHLRHKEFLYIWVWLTINQERLRRFWSMCPLTRVPFWYRFVEPQPFVQTLRQGCNQEMMFQWRQVPSHIGRNHGKLSFWLVDVILPRLVTVSLLLTCFRYYLTPVSHFSWGHAIGVESTELGTGSDPGRSRAGAL